MRKSIFMLLSLCLMACSASKGVRTAEKTIKGNWSLSTITYSKTGDYNVSLLNDVSKACLESSTWQFIPNNHTGLYSIVNSNCDMGERHFNFTVQEVNAQSGQYDFLLKPTNEKGKSETNQGFRFNIKTLTDTKMQWQQTVYANGTPFIINMNFVKIQD